MNRRFLFLALCIGLLMVVCAIAALGYLAGRPFQLESGGQSRPSPDGKWVAHAFSREEWSLLGGTTRFSELRVEAKGPNGSTVRRMRVEDTAEPGIDWRIEGEVFWNRHSSAVTFKAVTGKANLDVTWRDF
jgi:hypothetical protein